MNFEAEYDVVVVGGGLLGAGIARDAAQRGLSVALFEAADYGAGAEASGSRLALGGLSALGTLDFTQVRDDIREREILLQTAPHLVHPQACLIPFYSSGLLAQTRLRAGLALSDALGFDLNSLDHPLRVHQLLSGRAARKRAPYLQPDGLLGAALVWEAAIPQIERLARELAFDARRHGAALFPQTQVEELCCASVRLGRERVGGVCWKNTLSGETGRTRSALVILAAGSGQAALLREVSGEVSVARPLVKTISVTGPVQPGLTDVLALPQEPPASLLLAVPQASACWAGSLTVPLGGNARYATGAEADALVQALQAALPGLDFAEVSRVQVAVHPPAAGEEVRDPASGGRCDGLLLVSGGSATRFRRIAEDAVDAACRKLGRALSLPPCRTASTLLPTSAPSSGDIFQLVDHAAAEEDCLTLRDFLERRTPLDWTDTERQAKAPDALATLANRLGWDAERRQAEEKAWKAEIALGQAFRVL